MKTAKLKNSPQKILVCQLGSLRDALFGLPLTVDIRRLWPEAEIHWIIECGADTLLETHSCIDRIIRIDRGWLRRPQQWNQLKSSLRDQRYDLTFDTLGLSKSGLLGWLTGASTRIGWSYPTAAEAAPWLATHRIRATARHRVDALRQLLSPWQEVSNGKGTFGMPHFSDLKDWADDLIRQQDLLTGNGWFCIHPGAIWPTAHWPIERFGNVAETLYRRHGLRSLVVWMDEHERLLSQVIAENSSGGAMVAPAMNLPELAEILRRSRFLLTGDSEPLQIASALGTPCVSLHGPSWADEVGAYGPEHIAVQSPLPNLSRRMNRRGPNTAMQAIEEEEVVYHVERLICRFERQGRLLAA